MSRDSIGKYLGITRRAHIKLLDQKLKPYHLSHSQIFLLASLYQKEGIIQHTLCEIHNIDKAAVGRSIDKLAKLGYLKKEPSSNDRRKKNIYLTKKAYAFQARFFEILDEVEAQLRANISPDAIDSFRSTIKQMAANLKQGGAKHGKQKQI